MQYFLGIDIGTYESKGVLTDKEGDVIETNYAEYSERTKILKDAKVLEKLGVFAIVLECIEKSLAKKITNEVKVPTIGIGSSVYCDGQILVTDDLIGLTNSKIKFVKKFTRTVPIEIHPLARNSVINSIKKLGGESKIRSLDRGYPFFTENGNIILDCDFGIISNPKTLTQKIKQTAGVLESGIFLRKPDIIYKANTNGKFEII